MSIIPDDSSLLTAYLDGELDPAACRSLEASMTVTPALARHLRELAGVRDLLGDLSRPTTPVGVSGPVMAWVSAHPPMWLRRRRLWRKVGGGRGMGLGLGLGASVGIALWAIWPRSAEIFVVVQPPPAAAAPPTPPPPPPAARPAPAVDIPPPMPTREPAPSVPTPSPEPYVSPPPALVESAQAEAARQVRRLLGRPSARLVPLSVDALDAPTMARVAEAVRSTGLRSPEYARIKLEVDGRPSIALALTADAREADRLISALRTEFAPLEVANPVPVPADLAIRLQGAPRPEYLLPERTPSAAVPSPKGSTTTKTAIPGTLVLWVRIGSARP